MAEPQDAVLPILRNIQDRLSAFEKRTDAGITDVKDMLLDQAEKVDSMHGLMHYHLGMTSEHQHQIAEIQKQLKDVVSRLASLEGIRT